MKLRELMSTILAGLLVSGLAFAHLGGGAREALGGGDYSNILWNGVQSVAGSDFAIATSKVFYWDGAGRTIGVTYDGTDVKILGAAPVTPASDQAINFGKPSVRWSNGYFGALNIGTSGGLTFTSTNPTVAACTSATRTNGTTTSFEMDVGTSCGAVSTVTLTLPAAPVAWTCDGRNITSGATQRLEQTGASSTTSVTLTNYLRTTGVAQVFTDGADLAINCTGR